jgi:UDP-N-acetylglucosamine--N-acetylmuramyl-(pentapeptide) pyrophosphoryl-undecaprenol N-acetylglucosamine transferase
LAEALRLERIVGENADSLWVTFSTPQTRGLLSRRRTHFLPYVPPRDVRGALNARIQIKKVISSEEFDQAISTGAAIAAASMPAVARRMPTYFIESLARMKGPSLTGQIIRAVSPNVELLSQNPAWAKSPWRYEGSLLDGWSIAPLGRQIPSSLKVLVTLGTIKPFRFDRALDAIVKCLRVDDEVVWQVGATSNRDLPGNVLEAMSQTELDERVDWADVVVAHSGVGSALMALERGKMPVLVTRSAAHQEHIDDHQQELTRELVTRSLAIEMDLDFPDRTVLEKAARVSIASRP